MRIAIIQGAFLPVPPLMGGAVEKIWYRMGQEFAANGHEVIHIGRSYLKLPETEVSNGVNYVRVKGYNTPSSLIKLKLLDLLYSLRAISKVPKDIDIIVSNTFWSPFLLRGASGKKVYVDVQRVPKGQMKFYKHVGKLRGCSPIIAKSIKDELPTSFHNLVSYVPNPVPFDIRPTTVQRKKTILFVGRLHPEKGVHVLIEAYSKLPIEIRKIWKLIIVGPHDFKDGGGGDEYYNKLVSLAQGLEITFSGSVYDENVLINHYAGSSIFCYPAQDGSGDAAPVAPREAMAYGCVPVVSQLECFNDFIFNNKNGVTYNQNSGDQVNELSTQLKYLIENPEKLENMSEEGKKVNLIYAPSVIAGEFINDFKKLIVENH